MVFDYSEYRVLLACGACDMRKNVNGLCDIVMSQFSIDPREKIMFAFCNRARNRIKILVWSDNGFWVHFKRLEKGGISWPEKIGDEMTMDFTIKELETILESPGIKQKMKREAVWKA